MTRQPLKSITLIALTGPAGCGKDTVADLLVAHRGFTKLAFADALRSEVAAAFAIDPVHLTRRETKEHPLSALALDHCLDPAFVECMNKMFQTAGLSAQLLSVPRSPRQILQWWGTEYRRTQASDYWTIQADNAIYVSQLKGDRRFVISDCRFDNEAAMVRLLEGSIWQVVRPGQQVAPGAHISETYGAQFLPDALLDNSQDIEHLQHQVLAAFDGLGVADSIAEAA